MAKYKLGRKNVATIPGIENDNIKDVTLNVGADELDVTTFKSTALTKAEYMAGLVDVSIEIVCTAHSATIGLQGAQEIASIDTEFEAIVLNVAERVTPKGDVQYTVTYGLALPEA